jgi:hypothetical protein
MTISYDAGSHGLRGSVFFRWRGTIFPLVLSDPLFWMLITLHCVLLVLKHRLQDMGRLDMPPIEWKSSTGLVSLISFFLIYYADHCYRRFLRLHRSTVTITHCVNDWSQLVQLHFSHLPFDGRWQMARKMLGAMQYHFAHIRREGTHLGVSKQEFETMIRSEIFTEGELHALHRHKGFRPLVATTWALDEVKLALLIETAPTPSDTTSGGAVYECPRPLSTPPHHSGPSRLEPHHLSPLARART